MLAARSSVLTLVSAAALLLPLAAEGQTLTTFHPFNLLGQTPYASLSKVGQYLYGTTAYGGTTDRGTVYAVNLNTGVETVRHSFGGSDGQNPFADLVKIGAYLYGTTDSGGTSGFGTAFKIETANPGTLTTLHSFAGGSGDGATPSAGLTPLGGFLYGATQGGGTAGFGTVFKMDLSGNLAWVHSFTGGNDGQLPYGGLVALGGQLYGTTQGGGTAGLGTVFKMGVNGIKVTLHSFAGGSDGASPESALVSFAGALFGTTKIGGASNLGTVFRITTAGATSTVYAFAGGSDGAYPFAAVLPVTVNAGSPALLYGTTIGGGTSGKGTLFTLTLGGIETTLYTFTGAGDGQNPEGTLLDVGGLLYGTTDYGGPWGKGTIYAFTP